MQEEQINFTDIVGFKVNPFYTLFQKRNPELKPYIPRIPRIRNGKLEKTRMSRFDSEEIRCIETIHSIGLTMFEIESKNNEDCLY